MGRPRKNTLLPHYVSEFKDRHGRKRLRFRRTGWRTTYVHVRPGTPEFTQAYRSWESDGRVKPGLARVRPGSFEELIILFYNSHKWKHDLRDATREQYRGQLERFREKFGSLLVAEVEAHHFRLIFELMGETPTAANNLRKRLRQLMNFAILEKFCTKNPVLATEHLKTKQGGFPDWSEKEIEKFEARHPVGTRARLAFDLALFTAQRKADICTLGPSNILQGRLEFTQSKTGKEMSLQIQPNLAASLATADMNGEAFILNDWGKPYTIDSFGMWFKRRCLEAGLKDRSMHGLRKAAARRLAESGCSNQEIKAVTGHTSDTEVARYTAGASQRRVSDNAYVKVDLANRLA